MAVADVAVAAVVVAAQVIEVETPRWLLGLNPEQRAAVVHRDTPLLVIAGAGSGKTRTLAARVADLIAGGTPPERILLLTFTRRAAREMVARVQGLTGDPAARHVWGGTFHAMGNRILRRYGAGVGLAEGFTVLDQGDSADLLGLIRGDLGFGDRASRFPKKDTIASIYSRTVNAQEPLGDVLDTAFPWCREHRDDLARIFREYVARKRAHNVADYDDLLMYWRALARSPELGSVLEGLFDHVLVDEYQDVNRVQADILFAMTQTTGGVTAVGDDAQAIYGFRAASVANIDEFPQRWPGTRVVTLERNYRSTPQILSLANAVMDASRDRPYAKRLWSDRPTGPVPVLAVCADETAQSAYVCDNVLEARERGIALRDQAVLFRTGHHSDALELELARRDIPFVKFGGLKFLEAGHIRDVLALLRILDNPRDVLAWSRVIASLPGCGPATVREVTAALGLSTEVAEPGAANAADEAGAGALYRFLHEPIATPASASDSLDELRAALADCGADRTDAEPRPSEQLDRLRAFCDEVFRRRYPDAEARLADIEQLAVLSQEYGTRSRFLAELTLDPPNSTGDHAQPPHLDDDYLNLSTIHSAKGGEWNTVHVIHAADGNIPSDMATTDPAGVEEERRLFYVALTRARDELYVTYPQRFYHRRYGLDDDHNYAQATRFLDGSIREHVTVDGVGAAVPVLDAIAVVDPVTIELDALWG